jgi:D-alanine-D-alanine ligase
MSNLKVAILVPEAGPAESADRADTFRQAAEISECLTILGNQSLTMAFAADRRSVATALTAARPDLVINLVEDLPEGPDQLHLVTALLDGLGLLYAGAPTAALAALGDKRDMKAALRRAGLPTPAGLADPQARYIVKSAIEHASIGLDAGSVVDGAAAARAAIAARGERHGGPWFAEAFIDGREFNLGLIETPAGPALLPVAEILFLAHAGRPRIVGYAEKWAEGSAAYAETPRVFPDAAADRPLLAALGRLGLETWRLFGLRGYARIDFRVDERGAPYIVDVNANPCLARDAGFCAAAAQAGMTQTDIVAHLIEAALG